jgi:hypothetical protein
LAKIPGIIRCLIYTTAIKWQILVLTILLIRD